MAAGCRYGFVRYHVRVRVRVHDVRGPSHANEIHLSYVRYVRLCHVIRILVCHVVRLRVCLLRVLLRERIYGFPHAEYICIQGNLNRTTMFLLVLKFVVLMNE
jgi:uncharacterized membrane protein